MERELGVYKTMAPWLVPGWESKNKTPFLIDVPVQTLDGVPLTEFYTLTFNLNNKIPVKRIFPDRSNRMVTQNDFSKIIDYIGILMLKNNIFFKM